MPSPLRTYPDAPNRHRLSLPSGHTLAYQRHGPRTAPAWLVLHGGPGSGAQAGLWQAIDLTHHQVVAPDQRGSGHSAPAGTRRRQALTQLIDELEQLRRSLGLKTWSVLGGSWGATLGLMYTARHPHAVDSLVLRGSFRGTPTEVLRLCRRFWPRTAPAPHLHRLRPASTPGVLQALSQVFQSGAPTARGRHTAQAWLGMERAAALHGAARAWRHAPPGERRVPMRRAWQRLRHPPLSPPDGRRLWQKFRIQAHLLGRRCGLRPGDWDRALHSLAAHGIPVTWVHGRFDAVCPPQNSVASHQRLASLPGGHSRLLLTQAGHLGTEPATLDALRVAVRHG